MTPKTISRTVLLLSAAVAAILLLFQLVPYGRDHSRPPVVAEPGWDPSTRQLAVRACFDCHSNETRWPWYSQVAPVSWLVQHDVEEGRRVLNFSEWNRPQEGADDSAESVLKAEMPLRTYLWMHPSARLAPAESRALAAGLSASLGAAEGGVAEEDDDD
jgi:hypothetical protein